MAQELKISFQDDEAKEFLRESQFGFSTEGAVGLDLVATSIVKNTVKEVWYQTGIAIEPPEGYAGFLYPRSSVSETEPRILLANSVGVIDPDYRGLIQVRFNKMYRSLTSPYRVGDRIAQLVFKKALSKGDLNVKAVESLSKTERGEGGFGSTGE